MASSRNSTPADPGAETRVRAAIAASFGAGPRPCTVAIALSGGLDSMVLLDALASQPDGLTLGAVHVHHGLSCNADAWAEFCAAQCAARDVPFSRTNIRPARRAGVSLEAAARAARYGALLDTSADVLALAHHADDQVETVLLQLLRGAGPHGLAAMPRARGARPAIVRPFLALTRATLAAYATARGVASVDDESNSDTGYKRNLLRADVAPLLAEHFPGYQTTIARAARHQADAAGLLDELAQIDAGDDVGATGLAQGRLATLAPARARNLLRWFLRSNGLRAPSEAHLAAMLGQLVAGAPDASIHLPHDGAVVGRHRGRVLVHSARSASFERSWRGESELDLPGGTLAFVPIRGGGVRQCAPGAAHWTVRSRAGGESLRLVAGGSRRSLKKLLQAADVPTWEREALPLLWRGDDLVAVPGIGIAVEFQAGLRENGWRLDWKAAARREPSRVR